MSMTPDEHRAEAEGLLDSARGYNPAHPMRADMLARATVHAVLSLAVPAWSGFNTVDAMDNAGRAMAEGMVAGLDAATGTPTSITVEQQADYVPPKPAPRKRAAKKTTAPKETTK